MLSKKDDISILYISIIGYSSILEKNNLHYQKAYSKTTYKTFEFLGFT